MICYFILRTRRPQRIAKPLMKVLSPQFALRPEQPSLPLGGQQIVFCTEPHHVLGTTVVIARFDTKEPLAFPKTVFLPPVEDEPDKGKHGQITLLKTGAFSRYFMALNCPQRPQS